MRNENGQFKKGEHNNPAGEFKKGQHWRPHQAFRDKDWLENEYTVKRRSASDIAAQFGVTENAILYWIGKHEIPTRSMKQVREMKHWGSNGEANGMYGKRGSEVPGWKGGCTPERQAFYSSIEWARASLKVWRRDKAKCRRCGVGSDESKLHVHHIIPFYVREYRSDPDNLVLLCVKCHRFVHSKRNVHKEFIGEEVMSNEKARSV